MENEVRTFYNQYGEQEWLRLDKSPYQRINFRLHMDFLREQLRPGMRILDAGCGAGRFSVAFAQMGCAVTLFDLSDEQLRIAQQKMAEHGLQNMAEGYVQGDIRDLSTFADGTFDLVVCYGAPLSYVLEGRETAISEFHRVLKEGGTLAASVNNRWGILRDLIGRGYQDFFNRPAYWFIDKVATTGDLPKHEKVPQPARHFFEADELHELIASAAFHSIELGASPCLTCGSQQQTTDLCQDEAAYQTILDLELQAYRKPSMLDSGEFLLAKGTK